MSIRRVTRGHFFWGLPVIDNTRSVGDQNCSLLCQDLDQCHQNKDDQVPFSRPRRQELIAPAEEPRGNQDDPEAQDLLMF